MICPNCGSPASKVIAVAMPMKLCHNDDCHVLWGEPFASIYTYLFAPIEGMISHHFCFMAYEGSYFKALWYWFRYRPIN